jgi:hypothetical protein
MAADGGVAGALDEVGKTGFPLDWGGHVEWADDRGQ